MSLDKVCKFVDPSSVFRAHSRWSRRLTVADEVDDIMIQVLTARYQLRWLPFLET